MGACATAPQRALSRRASSGIPEADGAVSGAQPVQVHRVRGAGRGGGTSDTRGRQGGTLNRRTSDAVNRWLSSRTSARVESLRRTRRSQRKQAVRFAAREINTTPNEGARVWPLLS